MLRLSPRLGTLFGVPVIAEDGSGAVGAVTFGAFVAAFVVTAVLAGFCGLLGLAGLLGFNGLFGLAGLFGFNGLFGLAGLFGLLGLFGSCEPWFADGFVVRPTGGGDGALFCAGFGVLRVDGRAGGEFVVAGVVGAVATGAA